MKKINFKFEAQQMTKEQMKNVRGGVVSSEGGCDEGSDGWVACASGGCEWGIYSYASSDDVRCYPWDDSSYAGICQMLGSQYEYCGCSCS